MTSSQTSTVWTLRCAQAGCDEPATHVAVEPHAMAMLFKGGAGVLCAKDARQFEAFGAVTMPLVDYAAAECGVREVRRLRLALEQIRDGAFSGNQAAEWAGEALAWEWAGGVTEADIDRGEELAEGHGWD
jgi:hypothetical protein